MSDIAARVQILEDLEDIRRLKARACYLADCKDANGFASLFADDGVFEGAIQRHEGRLEIANSIRFWPLAVHYVTNPIIEVSRDRGKGQWFFLRPQCNDADEAFWVAGWYRDEYVKIDQVWKFKKVAITNLFSAPYEAGWSTKTSAEAYPDMDHLEEFRMARIQ